jgi:rhamnosyl/mannosyltransferase
MRILHVFKSFYPDSVGGIERTILTLSHGLSDLGHTSNVLTLSPSVNKPTLQNFEGVVVHQAPRIFELAATGFSISFVSMLRHLASEYDVIHYHFPWPWMDVAHLWWRARSALQTASVVTYHSDVVRQRALMKVYRPLMMRFLDNVDAIVATSPNYVSTSSILQKFSTKVSVVPLGLEDDSVGHVDSARVESWKRKIGNKFFLFVGVLRYYKGLHILLHAMRYFDVPVVIAGAGPIEGELREMAGRLGIRNVYFTRYVDEPDKLALLSSCRAVLFPSHLRSEAFGLSLLEGAVFGKPMISSEIGTGTSFVNDDGTTGFVVPPGNPEAFANAMRILWHDDVLCAKLGNQARQRYLLHFTSSQMVSGYLKVYSRIISMNS